MENLYCNCRKCQASDRIMELRYKNDLEPWELCEIKFLRDLLRW
jgi:hypothetical protein